MSTSISIRQIWPILLAPFVLAACSDALAPAPGLNVAVRISDQQGPFPSVNPGSADGMVCDVTFEAQALGRDAHATWLGASVLFYVPNSSAPYDSISVSANDLRATFSADTIGAGQVEHTRWLFSVSGALNIAMSFRYRVDPGADIKSATAYLTCGGAGPSTATRLPGMKSPSVSPLRSRINGS